MAYSEFGARDDSQTSPFLDQKKRRGGMNAAASALGQEQPYSQPAYFSGEQDQAPADANTGTRYNDPANYAHADPTVPSTNTATPDNSLLTNVVIPPATLPTTTTPTGPLLTNIVVPPTESLSADPYSYQNPFYGFDASRETSAKDSLKYNAMTFLRGVNPTQWASDAAYRTTQFKKLSDSMPGYELDADGNIMLTGTADGYIGARPESWSQGTGQWGTPNAWQWLSYNQAHPGPAGEGTTGNASQPGYAAALQAALSQSLGGASGSGEDYQTLIAKILQTLAAAGTLNNNPFSGGG